MSGLFQVQQNMWKVYLYHEGHEIKSVTFGPHPTILDAEEVKEEAQVFIETKWHRGSWGE